jgi:hypothetical protein
MIYRRELHVGLLTALAAAALTLTGCSASATGSAVGATSDGAGTTRPALPATSDPVVWMNRVCGSLLPLHQALRTAPPPTARWPPRPPGRSSRTPG